MELALQLLLPVSAASGKSLNRLSFGSSSVKQDKEIYLAQFV